MPQLRLIYYERSAAGVLADKFNDLKRPMNKKRGRRWDSLFYSHNRINLLVLTVFVFVLDQGVVDLLFEFGPQFFDHRICSQ